MIDVIKKIAESDPLVEFGPHGYVKCFHCKEIRPDENWEKHDWHAPDCLWVWCREQMKEPVCCGEKMHKIMRYANGIHYGCSCGKTRFIDKTERTGESEEENDS